VRLTRSQSDEEIFALLRRAERSKATVSLSCRLLSGAVVLSGVPRGVTRSSRFFEVISGERTRLVGLPRVEAVRVVPERQGRDLRPLRPAPDREAEREEDDLDG